MYQIGIISRPSRELYRVRAELSRYSYYDLKTYTDAPNAISILKSQKLSALVVIIDQFNQKQLELIEKIRGFHPGLPIAFITQAPLFDSQEQVRKIEKTILMSWDREIADVGGVLLRMIRGQKVYNRNYQRQKALQPVSIQDSRESIIHGCVLDLTSGGARVRAFTSEYKRGDSFTVKIPLTYLRKSYSVKAEVVWSAVETSTLGTGKSSQLLGLRFISVAG